MLLKVIMKELQLNITSNSESAMNPLLGVDEISARVFKVCYGPIINELDSRPGCFGFQFTADDIPNDLDRRKIWTVVYDEGEIFLRAGARYWSSMGYFITRRPWKSLNQVVYHLKELSDQ